eukprot:2222799-Rhodomonas_salina.1
MIRMLRLLKVCLSVWGSLSLSGGLSLCLGSLPLERGESPGGRGERSQTEGDRGRQRETPPAATHVRFTASETSVSQTGGLWFMDWRGSLCAFHGLEGLKDVRFTDWRGSKMCVSRTGETQLRGTVTGFEDLQRAARPL